MKVFAGDSICRGVWMDRLPGAQNWWTMTAQPCVVRLQEVVHPNLPLLAVSESNPLRRGLQRQSVEYANEHGAWKVTDKDHASMIAAGTIREMFEGDNNVDFDSSDEESDEDL